MTTVFQTIKLVTKIGAGWRIIKRIRIIQHPAAFIHVATRFSLWSSPLHIGRIMLNMCPSTRQTHPRAETEDPINGHYNPSIYLISNIHVFVWVGGEAQICEGLITYIYIIQDSRPEKGRYFGLYSLYKDGYGCMNQAKWLM